jgi:hypothetical protein
MEKYQDQHARLPEEASIEFPYLFPLCGTRKLESGNKVGEGVTDLVTKVTTDTRDNDDEIAEEEVSMGFPHAYADAVYTLSVSVP